MKVLIDTNVIIDVLANREPYVEYSARFLKICGVQVSGFIVASQTTDIFYLLCRLGMHEHSAKDIIRKLTDNIKVAGVTVVDIQNALASDVSDYEDGLLSCCAKRLKAQYIVTRNIKDFALSPVPALSPQMFLEKYFS